MSGLLSTSSDLSPLKSFQEVSGWSAHVPRRKQVPKSGVDEPSDGLRACVKQLQSSGV